jgi:hypothetical protein
VFPAAIGIAHILPWTRSWYVEHHNLSVRMTVRRFTGLTSAFSKKCENRCAAVALGYFAYNFIKVNRTLRMTPATAAGVTPRLREVSGVGSLRSEREKSGISLPR